MVGGGERVWAAGNEGSHHDGLPFKQRSHEKVGFVVVAPRSSKYLRLDMVQHLCTQGNARVGA